MLKTLTVSSNQPAVYLQEVSERAQRVDRPLSLFLNLDQLKTYYVQGAYESDPLVYLGVPRCQTRSFIQQVRTQKRWGAVVMIELMVKSDFRELEKKAEHKQGRKRRGEKRSEINIKR